MRSMPESCFHNIARPCHWLQMINWMLSLPLTLSLLLTSRPIPSFGRSSSHAASASNNVNSASIMVQSSPQSERNKPPNGHKVICNRSDPPPQLMGVAGCSPADKPKACKEPAPGQRSNGEPANTASVGMCRAGSGSIAARRSGSKWPAFDPLATDDPHDERAATFRKRNSSLRDLLAAAADKAKARQLLLLRQLNIRAHTVPQAARGIRKPVLLCCQVIKATLPATPNVWNVVGSSNDSIKSASREEVHNSVSSKTASRWDKVSPPYAMTVDRTSRRLLTHSALSPLFPLSPLDSHFLHSSL